VIRLKIEYIYDKITEQRIGSPQFLLP